MKKYHGRKSGKTKNAVRIFVLKLGCYIVLFLLYRMLQTLTVIVVYDVVCIKSSKHWDYLVGKATCDIVFTSLFLKFVFNTKKHYHYRFMSWQGMSVIPEYSIRIFNAKIIPCIFVQFQLITHLDNTHLSPSSSPSLSS